MGDPGKRKLSAKEILTDIRSGADADGLKNKYGLSDKSLESVMGKLLTAGALTEKDMLRFKAVAGAAQPSHQPASGLEWRCPACNTPQPHEMSECPACGIIVAKFAAHQIQTNQGTTSIPAPVRHDARTSQATGSWTYVIWSIVALTAVAGGIIVWSMHRSNRNAEIAVLSKVTPQSSQTVVAQPDDMASQEESASIAYPASVMESFKSFSANSAPAGDTTQATTSTESKPSGESKPPASSANYVTGVLRQFDSGNFKAEVVEASKTYPVLFQFYSDT